MCNMKPEINHEDLTALLHYDPDTGLFTQRLRWWNRPAGATPGGKTPQGYWAIGIGGKQYLAHRLAWFYVHKAWPDADIDHINRDRLDNRLCNLRVTSRSTNLHNVGICLTNTSGVKNVSKNARGKWQAQITVEGKRHYLGSFKDLTDAENAVIAARAKFKLPSSYVQIHPVHPTQSGGDRGASPGDL